MTKFLAILLVSFSFSSHAYKSGDIFLDPHIAVGVNAAQGTHFIGGLDAGYALNEQMAVGVHGYYSAGENPRHDREMGAGPFFGYTQPFTSFLLGHVRQEINYVDLYDPVEVNGSVIGHTQETGTASVTSAGLHLFMTRNFGLSVGYRLVLALANSALDDGRSGFFLGFSIGI